MPLFGRSSTFKAPFGFRPFYLIVIWALMAGLFLVSGWYESQRTKANLRQLLLDEGAALIAGFEKSLQAAFSSLTAQELYPAIAALMTSSPNSLLAFDEALIDLGLEIALEIDQRLGPQHPDPRGLEKLGEKEFLAGMELLTPKGEFHYRSRETPQPPTHFLRPILAGELPYALFRSEKKGTGQMDALVLAIARKAGPGILIIYLDETTLQRLRRRLILQGLIDEWKSKGEVQYIVFQGEDGEIWGHTESNRVGQKEEMNWLREVQLTSEGSFSRDLGESEKILEVGRTFIIHSKMKGFLRVGLSTARIDEILANDRRSLILFSLLLLISGGMGVTILYSLENRYLTRLREMEEKVKRSEKLSSLAQLAAGVAHEIRNPLNAISMGIQRLQREFSPAQGEEKEFRQYTNVMREEIRRVNEIIEQFLSFSRPIPLIVEETSLSEILDGIFRLGEEMARAQNVSLEKNWSLQLPPLRLDRKRMHEALWNLFRNGLEAMPKGGNLKVTAALTPGGRQVLIEFEDTGVGIAEENMGKIFDYYFTTKTGGVGLGLPLAHKIIQEHGGSIRVQSREGQGTKFQVILPVPKEQG
jgi:signal transduction histidine kinase